MALRIAERDQLQGKDAVVAANFVLDRVWELLANIGCPRERATMLEKGDYDEVNGGISEQHFVDGGRDSEQQFADGGISKPEGCNVGLNQYGLSYVGQTHRGDDEVPRGRPWRRSSTLRHPAASSSRMSAS